MDYKNKVAMPFNVYNIIYNSRNTRYLLGRYVSLQVFRLKSFNEVRFENISGSPFIKWFSERSNIFRVVRLNTLQGIALDLK